MPSKGCLSGEAETQRAGQRRSFAAGPVQLGHPPASSPSSRWGWRSFAKRRYEPARAPPCVPNAASAAVFLKNRCCVKSAIRAGIADMEHDNCYAELVECMNIDWHKPEGAIAVL
jgi:hypothetical protein